MYGEGHVHAPPVHTSFAPQVVPQAPQLVTVVSDVHAPPQHALPAPPGQAWFELLAPLGSLLQTPGIPASAQLWHTPLQAVLQHTPSTQNPLEH
jgi:hypothetical protein